ncbi:MAG: hypothetical protein H0T73_10205 [Ardenticatenales bacterium]|nr:hypothetical protein [Ardenticatenales bacterium]
MIELPSRADRLPLQLASPLLNAPGVWAPGSRLPLESLGALVTPLLSLEWDGDASAWESGPGTFIWAPPRRPLKRFLQRLGRERSTLPHLLALAPATPGEIGRTLAEIIELEEEQVAGYLLWHTTPDMVSSARSLVPALPLLAELPCTETVSGARALVEAGADSLWVGPPQVEGGKRLWGPAALPLLLAAITALHKELPEIPLIAGAGIASPSDAQRARTAGAALIALDPAWWVQPGLASEIASSL